MTTETTERDLIEEVEELLASPNSYVVRKEVRELLRRMVEEVKRLRQFGCEHCNCPCANCGRCGDNHD